jgi:hypothetical protein
VWLAAVALRRHHRHILFFGPPAWSATIDCAAATEAMQAAGSCSRP